MISKDIQGVVVRWCSSYAMVWSVEYNHSCILCEDTKSIDFDSLYPTQWIAFDVDSRIYSSPEGVCTRAFNPRPVRKEYSINPETTENDYHRGCAFVYRFIKYGETIRFKTRLRRFPDCNKSALFDEFAGDVAVSDREYEQLIRYNIEDVDLCKLGKLLHGPGGRVVERRQVVIPPDKMRPSSNRQNAVPIKESRENYEASTSAFLHHTRDERLKEARSVYQNARPWGKLSSNCESIMEVTVNFDCIIVYRHMNESDPEFYVIFSKTHKFGILCDGGINLEVGKWARLRYIGGELQPLQYLSSKSLCLICYITPPVFVVTKRYKRTQLLDEKATYIVVLTLRADIENTEDGDLFIHSSVVGPIKIDTEWYPCSPIPKSFPKGAVIEIEFVRDSWFLRKLHGHWHDGFDFRRLDSPYIMPGYTVEEAESSGRRYPHGIEKYQERTASTHCFSYGSMRRPSSYPINSSQDKAQAESEILLTTSNVVEKVTEDWRRPFRDRQFRPYSFGTLDENNDIALTHDDFYFDIGRDEDFSLQLLQQSAEHGVVPLHHHELSSSHRCLVVKDPPKQWVPPTLSPNLENLVDVASEKPSGKDRRRAWSCAVHVQGEYIIGYTPVESIHKILIPAPLIEKSLLLKDCQSIRLGVWMHVSCELRTKREYDTYREPRFSHIAVELHGVPGPLPPIKNWEQRTIHGLFQFCVYCDLRIPGNVQRVQVGNEKMFKLLCENLIKVLVPFERLEDLLSAQLTADKSIKFWATRKKRALNCDLFLIDCEAIEEV